MKFHLATVVGLLVSQHTALAFAPQKITSMPRSSSSSALSMALDMPPPAADNSGAAPVVQANRGGAPSEVRYSDFLKMVNGNKVEKVTFSADGSQLLGVDNDGNRLRIEALPNDPDLLTSLTQHKVCFFKNGTIFWHLTKCCPT